jgi:hypothetical protein
MSTTPRNLPRFLPTLTEVVDPTSLHRHSVAPAPELDEIVQTVQKQVAVVLERRMAEEIDVLVHTLVTEQLQTMRARLHEELETVVRQVVSEFMRTRADLHQHKS